MRSIISRLVPILRASEKRETPAARLMVAYVWRRVDPGRPDRRLPIPGPEVVQAHVTASKRREEQGRVEARREGVESVHDALTPELLGVLASKRVDATHRKDGVAAHISVR